MRKQKVYPANFRFMSAFGGMLLSGALFLSVFSFSSTDSFAKEKDVKIGASSAPTQMNSLAKQLNETFHSVSNAVLPTVVSINVKFEKKSSPNQNYQEFEGFEDFFGFPFGGGGRGFSPFDNTPSEGSGSGVIISENGYIITNNHVIDNASEIKVTTYDKKTYTAELIGTDPATDLAVIKIDASKLPLAYFANIDDVKIGEMVLAVGNPLGLNSTITQGVVSAIGRGSLNLRARGGKQTVENFIQTDAAINPGNSGGGLFDLNGALIGINTAIASQNGSFIGYGFAVPIDLVKNIAEDLIEDGEINRGYIGVQFEPVSEAMAKALNMEKIIGVVVQDVVKKSPAEKAGIEIGDVIIAVDGKEITSSNQLQGLVFTKKSGEKVELTLLRDGKKSKKTLTLDPLDKKSDKTKSNDNSKFEDDVDTETIEAKINGLEITVEKLNSESKSDYGVDYGVIVTKVERGSDAQKNFIQPGTIILKADKKKINSPYDLSKIIRDKKSGDAVLLQVKFKDVNRMVALIIK